MSDTSSPSSTSPAAFDLATQSSGVLITGANGHLGRRLLRALDQLAPGLAGRRALVRSASAEAALARSPHTGITAGSYTDPAVLERAIGVCDTVVHLVGIIKESAASSFHDAHIGTTEALVAAAEAAGVRRIIYLSIVGAALDHSNECLRTKAEAERRLVDSSVASTVLRVPMVLGEGDYASAALRRRATAGRTLVFRADSLEQPIYAGDVVTAMLRAMERRDGADVRYDLPGPETLSRRALIERAAAVLGQRISVRSLPIGLGMTMAWVLEKLTANPPVTRAMLGVLDHDDEASNVTALDELPLELTDLDEMLRRCLELPA